MGKAILAGGCFWCMQEHFEKLKGVQKVVCGYTGGKISNPTYEEVKSGKTGHYEAILVEFDEKIISYKDLLIEFLSNIDPTDSEGQFIDKGTQYRSAIFYLNQRQRKTAEDLLKNLEDSKIFDEIYVKLLPKNDFYKAEGYHQKYYISCPLEYMQYKNYSGRIHFIKKYGKKIKKLLGENND